MLHVSKVSKRFAGKESSFTAVDNVSFKLGKGINVIIGPSGCGKSTLLNMVAGFSRPSSGQILVDGAQIIGPSRKIGFVFQKPALFPWMSAESNINFGPALLGESSEQNALLLQVGLLEFGGHYPFMLSVGMQQRVALARALANKPKLLLMDEPFASLDAITRKKMADLVLSIHASEKMPILMVTHDIEEAIKLGDKIIVMSKNPGKIRAIFNNPIKNVAIKKENFEKIYNFREKLSNLLETQEA